MKPQLRLCPFRGCSVRIPAGRFCCVKHWVGMPAEARNSVFEANLKHRDGFLTVQGYADYLELVLDWVDVVREVSR